MQLSYPRTLPNANFGTDHKLLASDMKFRKYVDWPGHLKFKIKEESQYT